MATQIQFRRGTTAQHATFTGAAGEVTVDTDKNVVVVHDGATAGGFPVPSLESVYPVGSLYFNASNGTNPAILFGFGTWTALGAGQVLLGVGTHTDTRSEERTFAAGDTGGAYQHVLSSSEMPAHNHGFPASIWSAQSGTFNVAHTAGGNAFHTLSSTNSVGSGSSHNNMQPYLAVYIWQRTA